MKAKSLVIAILGVLTGLLWAIPSFLISMITMVLGIVQLFLLYPLISYIIPESITALLFLVLHKFVSKTYAIAFLVTASIISFITPFLALLIVIIAGVSG